MNTSTRSYAFVIRGLWFQLKSLAKTTFFLQKCDTCSSMFCVDENCCILWFFS